MWSSKPATCISKQGSFPPPMKTCSRSLCKRDRLHVFIGGGKDPCLEIHVAGLLDHIGIFPTTYEDMQPVPVQEVGQLTFAGDDGMQAGQTYRARVKVAHFCEVTTRTEQTQATLGLKLRAPDQTGMWAWGEWSHEIPLPETVVHYLAQGAQTQAPTLRELRNDDGSRVAAL